MSSILIADDDVHLVQLLSFFCRSEGFEVASCADGASTLARVGEAPQPDAILVDLGLPDMPGLELLESLRARPESASIPVVVLSGRVDAEDRAAAERLGAADVIEKPVDPRALCERLRTLLASRAVGR